MTKGRQGIDDNLQNGASIFGQFNPSSAVEVGLRGC